MSISETKLIWTPNVNVDQWNLDHRYFNKIILGTCDFNKKEEMINIINNELN